MRFGAVKPLGYQDLCGTGGSAGSDACGCHCAHRCIGRACCDAASRGQSLLIPPRFFVAWTGHRSIYQLAAVLLEILNESRISRRLSGVHMVDALRSEVEDSLRRCLMLKAIWREKGLASPACMLCFRKVLVLQMSWVLRPGRTCVSQAISKHRA